MTNVTRVCSEDGQWLEPIGLQDCYDDNVNERFDEISELLNQVSLKLIGIAYKLVIRVPN